jgi:hypothetical protein
MSIVSYVQILLIGWLRYSTNRVKRLQRSTTWKHCLGSSAYLYEVLCFVFCQFYHQWTDEFWCFLHMSVVSMLKNVERYLGAESCHSQNVFICVVIWAPLCLWFVSWPHFYMPWWGKTCFSSMSYKSVPDMSSAECGSSIKPAVSTVPSLYHFEFEAYRLKYV